MAAILDELASLFDSLARLNQGDSWVLANGEAVLTTVETVLPAPELATRLFDGEKKPAA